MMEKTVVSNTVVVQTLSFIMLKKNFDWSAGERGHHQHPGGAGDILLVFHWGVHRERQPSGLSGIPHKFRIEIYTVVC
jgi:hypothetical protein